MTHKEAKKLANEGLIEPIGTTGHTWKMRVDLPMRPDVATGRGRLSLEISRIMFRAMFAEMCRRSSWNMEEM